VSKRGQNVAYIVGGREGIEEHHDIVRIEYE
jgi:hypothetical protein